MTRRQYQERRNSPRDNVPSKRVKNGHKKARSKLPLKKFVQATINSMGSSELAIAAKAWLNNKKNS